MIDNRNLILAIVLSLSILLGFEFLFNAPQRERLAEQQRQEQALIESGQGELPQSEAGIAPALPGGIPAGGSELPGGLDREQALAEVPRILVDTPTLTGSIALKGARIDDLTLKGYRESIEDDSPNIVLFSPASADQAYFAGFGWSSANRDVALPGPDTLWQADRRELRPGQPVTLRWANSQGLRFEQVLELDESYMFTVTQRVVNGGNASVPLAPYGLISRTGHPDILGFYILHEGLIGVFDDTLKEIDYDDLEDDGINQFPTTGGWIGITDKYWQAVLVPDQERPVETRFVHNARNGQDKYQTDFLYAAAVLEPGRSVETTSRLFAGAKEVVLLDGYREELGIVNFDLAVDFGWFYFLTKPFFYALHYFAGVLGNFGLAILLLTVMIKIVFFPLANKSYSAMAKMKKLAPEMQKLKERFGDDRVRIQQETMALYKKEGANPMAGCLPIVIQIPVFFALYKVLFVSIEMRQAPFYGWIQDLSAPDPTSILNLFGLLPYSVGNLGILDVISIGVWPILMGLTMVLQHRLNPQPTDPMQAKIFMFMPIVFTFLLAQFPAGLVIYWTWNNLLSILQQMVIMKRAGVPIGRAAQAAAPQHAPPRPDKAAKDKAEQGDAEDQSSEDAEAHDDGGAHSDGAQDAGDDAQEQHAEQPSADGDGTAQPGKQAKSRGNRRRAKRRARQGGKGGTPRGGASPGRSDDRDQS